MARQTVTTLIDDIDGSEAHGTISFGLDGHVYEIDLSVDNDKVLRALLGPYLDAGRRIRPASGRIGSSRPAVSTKDRNTAMREWAASEGVELNARGRIAHAVQAAYDAQDGDALRAALGLELVQPKPRRARRVAEFSDGS